MPQDNLLREAIAEAKQVRSAAIANAQIALEEAFKPHLASMLTAKLRNEMEDHTKGDAHGTEDGGETDVKAVAEEVNPSSSDIGSGDNKEPSKGGRSSSNVPNPGQEIEAMGKGDAKKEPVKEVKDGVIAPGDGHEEVLDQLKEDDEFDLDVDNDGEEDMGDMGAGAAGLAAAGDDMGAGDEFGGEEQGGDALDLDALIRELEADILGMDPGAEEVPEAVPAVAAAPSAGLATEDVSATAAKDSVDQSLEFGKGGDKAPAGAPQHVKLSETDMDEEISLDELLREVDAELGDATDPNHYAKVESLQAENVELKRSLKEHRDVVRFLKDRITEINMLNAKLLFTNKLFKQFNLNPGQKMHVVETFDRATTLREVKLIYTTLAEAYTGKAGKVGSTAKQITEGLASKTTGSTKPKSEQKVLTEDTEVLKARFQKLAGINHNLNS